MAERVENIAIRDATLEDGLAILRAGVRSVDRDEWIYTSGKRLETAMRLTFMDTVSGDASRCAIAFRPPTWGSPGAPVETPLVVWGTRQVPMMPDTALVWLISTADAPERIGFTLHLQWRKEMALLEARLPPGVKTLMAFTLKSNVLHHKWLRSLGFTAQPHLELPSLPALSVFTRSRSYAT